MEHIAFRGLVGRSISLRTPPQSIVWNHRALWENKRWGPIKLCCVCLKQLRSLRTTCSLAWPQRRFVGTDAEGVAGSLSCLTTQYRLLSLFLLGFWILHSTYRNVCVLILQYQLQCLFSWRIWSPYLIW